MRMRGLFAATAVALLASTWAMAGSAPVVIVDEFGNGSFLGQALPVSFPQGGGVAYLLPFAVTPGVVQIIEPVPTAEILSDLIEFRMAEIEGVQRGLLIFKSDGSDGLDAPADVLQLPGISVDWPKITEIGPEGDNYAEYFPLTTNEPGANPGLAYYHFISDSPSVPLPGAAWMGIALMGGLVALRRRSA